MPQPGVVTLLLRASAFDPLRFHSAIFCDGIPKARLALMEGGGGPAVRHEENSSVDSTNL